MSNRLYVLLALALGLTLTSTSRAQVELWTASSFPGGQTPGWSRGAAADAANGTWYVAGVGAARAGLWRLDAAGTPSLVGLFDYGIGSQNYSLEVSNLISNGAGGVYIGGTWIDYSVGNSINYIRAYDAAGALQSSITLDPALVGIGCRLSRNPSGALHMASSRSTVQNSRQVLLSRLDPSGAIVWSTEFGSTNLDRVIGTAPALGDGLAAVGGTSGDLYAPLAGNTDAWYTRLDSNGNVAASLQFGTASQDEAWDVAEDGAGGHWVMGYTGGALFGANAGSFDVWLARIDAAGSIVRGVQIGGPDIDRPTSLVVDSLGGALILGYTEGSPMQPTRGWIMRFDDAGELTWTSEFPATNSQTLTIATNGDLVACGAIGAGGVLWRVTNQFPASLGTRECSPATSNSTGAYGELRVLGSDIASWNRILLRGERLPPGVFSLFLTSSNAASIPGAGGSLGTLCLGGVIGRFAGPGQVQPVSAAGIVTLELDLAGVPAGGSLMPVVAGETRRFQLWYRDLAGGAVASNYTNGCAVGFE